MKPCLTGLDRFRTERVTETTYNALDEPVTEDRYSQPTGGGARSGETWARANRDPAGNVTDRCTWAAAPPEWCHNAGDTSWASPPPTTRASAAFDARDQRISQYTPGLGATTYDPGAGYQVSGVYLPTAAGREHQTLYGYDGRDRADTITLVLCATSQRPCAGGNILSSRVADDYGYDDNDNRTSVAEDNGAGAVTRYYCHDGRNQLVAVSTDSPTCASGVIETSAYDAAGNRTSAAGRTFTYQPDGQLESCTGTACNPVHDADGRITSLVTATGTWSYLYDGDGRLMAACRAASCAGSGFARFDFDYDGEGHRTRITETPVSGTATVTEFTYEGDRVVREVATTGAQVRTRAFTVDEAGAIFKMTLATTGGSTADDGTYLVVWNGHGDTLELAEIDPTTGTLTPANRFGYSTWGKPTLATVNGYGDLGFRYRYVGRFDVAWDSTAAVPADLLYMHARHYAPEFGRFLQPDPADAEDNLYGYAGNSPVTKVDPSGRCPWCPLVQRLADLAQRIGSQAHRAGPWLQRLRGLLPIGFRITAQVRYDILKAASQSAPADKGGLLSAAGHALAKHASRVGSRFAAVTGNPAAINKQGQRIVVQILSNAVKTDVKHQRWGDIISIWDRTGRGIRVADPVKGPVRFIGFLDY